MIRIALMRHFPTAWNAEQRLQGRADVPLTDEAREILKGLSLPRPWDNARIISSPLVRATETATILARGRPVVLDEGLVELSWGAWEGRTAADLLSDPEADFRPTHEWDADTKAPEGESAREAWARLRPALAAIAADPAPAVVIAHKALMRLVLGNACNWQGMPEIKRGRLYPLTIGETGLPRELGEPVRLEPLP